MINKVVHMLSKYTLTTSHKIIGILYGYIGYIAGILGYIISMFIRMELNTQGLSLVRKVKEVTIYNNWITIHGLIMPKGISSSLFISNLYYNNQVEGNFNRLDTYLGLQGIYEIYISIILIFIFINIMLLLLVFPITYTNNNNKNNNNNVSSGWYGFVCIFLYVIYISLVSILLMLFNIYLLMIVISSIINYNNKFGNGFHITTIIGDHLSIFSFKKLAKKLQNKHETNLV